VREGKANAEEQLTRGKNLFKKVTVYKGVKTDLKIYAILECPLCHME
jgi:hypothetical protein